MEKRNMGLPDDEQIADLLKGLDDDLNMPFDVSVAWRKAVKAEARKRKWMGSMRWAAEIAAVLVVIVGATFMWRSLGVVKQTQSNIIGKPTGEYAFYTLSADLDFRVYAMDGVEEFLDGRSAVVEESILTTGSDFDDLLLTASKDDSDTEMCELKTEKQLVQFANVEVNSKDIGKDTEKLSGIVRDFDGAKFSENEFGAIRVKNEKLGEFLSILKDKFDCSVTVENKDISERMHDLSEEYSKACEEEDWEKVKEYDRKIKQSSEDLDYATVYFSIRSEREITAIAAASNGSFGGFLKDMAIISVIILPAMALGAYVALRIQKRRKLNV